MTEAHELEEGTINAIPFFHTPCVDGAQSGSLTEFGDLREVLRTSTSRVASVPELEPRHLGKRGKADVSGCESYQDSACLTNTSVSGAAGFDGPGRTSGCVRTGGRNGLPSASAAAAPSSSSLSSSIGTVCAPRPAPVPVPALPASPGEPEPSWRPEALELASPVVCQSAQANQWREKG